MNITPRRVVMLINENNACFVEDWLADIRDIMARVRIRRQIEKLSRGLFGNFKEIGEGVNELRLDFGPGYRVYYAHWKGAVVVLLLGGNKSSQDKDIRKAKSLWRDFGKAGLTEDDLPEWGWAEN